MNIQTAYLTLGQSQINLDIPNHDQDVIPGVKWGKVDSFPTVAYWLYCILAKRLEGKQIQYKLGRTLHEEVGACLLGGHGIPAAVGLAAYEQLKKKGAFDGTIHSEENLYTWLSEPISMPEKQVKYRFAKQKASYLHHALKHLGSEKPPLDSGLILRDWLTEIKGVGLKTASWVARNWLEADDVAILDIHIYRAGLLGGFFKDEMTVERQYKALEQIFVDVAEGMGVRTSELDAVMWFEMQQNPYIFDLLKHREQVQKGLIDKNSVIRMSPKKARTHTKQLLLI